MLSEKCKIMVCYHKPSRIFNDPLYFAVNAGRALLEQKYSQGILSLSEKAWLYRNTVGDDSGDNISDLNYSFCELTAVYWAWKNYEKIGSPEYIGFCHYRRIFDVDSQSFERFIGDNQIVYAGCSEFPSETCDLSVSSQFLRFHKDDLRKCLDYFEINNPSFHDSLEEYLAMPFDKSALYNMFIVRKDIFFEYCELLFAVLFHIREKINLSSYSQYGSRVFGFLAERLSGAFFYHKSRQGIKVKKSVPFFFEERFIRVSAEKVWAEKTEVICLADSGTKSLSCDGEFCIAVPLDGGNPDLSLLTVKSCISNAPQGQKCHIFLLSDTDPGQKKKLIRNVRNKIVSGNSLESNISVSLVVLSEKMLEEFGTDNEFSRNALNLLKVIKNNPSLWFLLLSKNICRAERVFWVNSGYLANDDFSDIVKNLKAANIKDKSVNSKGNDKTGINTILCGCESLYCFIADNEQKSLSDVQIDFSLPLNNLQTNFLYIDLNWLESNKLLTAENLVAFNGFYAINTTSFKDCVQILDYYWSVETNISRDFSSMLDHRLSFENFMKYSTFRRNWKGAFVADGDSSALHLLGIN